MSWLSEIINFIPVVQLICEYSQVHGIKSPDKCTCTHYKISNRKIQLMTEYYRQILPSNFLILLLFLSLNTNIRIKVLDWIKLQIIKSKQITRSFIYSDPSPQVLTVGKIKNTAATITKNRNSSAEHEVAKPKKLCKQLNAGTSYSRSLL